MSGSVCFYKGVESRKRIFCNFGLFFTSSKGFLVPAHFPLEFLSNMLDIPRKNLCKRCTNYAKGLWNFYPTFSFWRFVRFSWPHFPNFLERGVMRMLLHLFYETSRKNVIIYFLANPFILSVLLDVILFLG